MSEVPVPASSGLPVDVASIAEAAGLIRPFVVRTPLLPSPWPGLWLKPENLQPIGAFKIRGAITALARLDPSVRARGVIAHSSGNHAQAVAWAARMFGVRAHIVIPDNAPQRKIDATRALGATVELVPIEERFRRPAELAEQSGRAVVAPFDDPDVIAGQGTIGLEIAEDAARLGFSPAAVLVPVSGGGLLAGIATALAAVSPTTVSIGVEPELAADAAASLAGGTRIEWPSADTVRTVADGLRSTHVGALPWEIIRVLVRDIVTVTEDELLSTTRDLALQARLVAEPSGAAATAAYLHHRSRIPEGNAVAVVSGGNIDPALLRSLLD